MKQLIESIWTSWPARRPVYRPRAMCRVPETPIGFVSRSDPNFFFLARKF